MELEAPSLFLWAPGGIYLRTRLIASTKFSGLVQCHFWRVLILAF